MPMILPLMLPLLAMKMLLLLMKLMHPGQLSQCRLCLTSHCNSTPLALRWHSDMRPQLDERDDAFVAVELESADGHAHNPNGTIRICRQGMEKRVEASRCPSRVGDVDLHSLKNQEFQCPVWRGGESTMGAGEWEEGRGFHM